MIVAYIAHPIGGDVINNLKKIEAIGRQINLSEPNVIPFAHYYFDCNTLDDNNQEERERGIKNDIVIPILNEEIAKRNKKRSQNQ